LGVQEQAGARRPPAASRRNATVTRIGPADQAVGETIPVAAVQGTLALDLRGCTGMPRTPELRVIQGDGGNDDVRTWAARFAQAVVEVVGGDRPLTQLLRWTTGQVYSDLARRVRILARTAPATERLRTVRPQVRSVHVFQPEPECAEVSVHVRHGQRSRALAARLELEDGRWTCTDLQLG
jgi:hypothetical protein